MWGLRVRGELSGCARALPDVRRVRLGLRGLASVHGGARGSIGLAVAAGYEHLIDPRLAAALPKQLQLPDSALAAGYRAEEAGDLHVDAELAVRLAHRLDPDARADQVARALGDAAIALEVVDLGGSEGPEAIVAGTSSIAPWCLAAPVPRFRRARSPCAWS